MAALGVRQRRTAAIDGMVLMPMGALLRKLVPSVLMIVLVLGGLYAATSPPPRPGRWVRCSRW